MISESSDLLRLLGSGVRHTPGAATFESKPALIEGEPFAELLKQAERGDLSSHRRVSVENGSGVVLNEAQSLALSAAADRAEAAGVRRALVMLDDQALLLDVGTRSVVGKAEFSKGVLSGVDGVLKISSSTQSANGAAGSPALLRVPSVSPSDLARIPQLHEE